MSFEIVGPWTIPSRTAPLAMRLGERIGRAIAAVFLLVLSAAGIFLARRNVRLGRGDRRGALKIALFVETLMALSWLLREHHVTTLWEIGLFVTFAGWALFGGCLLWVFYIALEPFVRRRWPQILVSWTRLLSGEWKDPLVGRDVLAGCAGGVALTGLPHAAILTPLLFRKANQIVTSQLDALSRTGTWISLLSGLCGLALFYALGILFLLFVLRLITRNDWAAIAAFVVSWGLPNLFGLESPWIHAPFLFVFSAVFVLLLMRFGLLALAVGYFVFIVFNDLPITLHTGAWYSGIGFATLLVVAAITLYGFRISLGSRPLLEIANIED